MNPGRLPRTVAAVLALAVPGAARAGGIFGNGSSGALVVSSNMVLDDPNQRFLSIEVPAGRTLTVPSGAVLRVKDTFECSGTVGVWAGAAGGYIEEVTGSLDVGSVPPFRPVDAGVAPRGGGYGELGDDGQKRTGGAGGSGLDEGRARAILRPPVNAGGGGAGALSGVGGAGGGSLTIFAHDSITVGPTCVIQANAAWPGTGGGGGGGAGGIVILGSAGAIAVQGRIQAKGSGGGESNEKTGPGGGGGGGIVHLIAPSIDTAGGTIDVSGGPAGTAGGAGSVTESPRIGGGGGGACGGAGGRGGSVEADGDPLAAVSGSAGRFLQTNANPNGLVK